MTNYPEFTLAAIQAAPVYLNLDASTEKACQLIEEAAQKGAVLAAFGEHWLPGYPFFQRYSNPLWNRAFADYLANAVEIPSPTTDRLCQAARKAGIDVIIGVAERDARTQGTVYCTLLFIGREGKILGRHRKLKPTSSERMVWGDGDGIGLRVYERPYGRISGLNCYEHMMLLPSYSLMAQGTQIHIAVWPHLTGLAESSPMALLLSRVFAIQGACYVMAIRCLLRPVDVPEYCRESVGEGWTGPGYRGSSCIINPVGDFIAEAANDEEEILTARITLEPVAHAKAIVDVGGHYSRPDVLQLHMKDYPPERPIYSAGVDIGTKTIVDVPATANVTVPSRAWEAQQEVVTTETPREQLG